MLEFTEIPQLIVCADGCILLKGKGFSLSTSVFPCQLQFHQSFVFTNLSSGPGYNRAINDNSKTDAVSHRLPSKQTQSHTVFPQTKIKIIQCDSKGNEHFQKSWRKQVPPDGGNAYNFHEAKELEKIVDSSTLWCILDAHMILTCSSWEINVWKR
jgi:hypothetical protein